jgi:hypothetical protein
MRKLLGSLVILLLCSVPAAAQKVYVDYDRTADFDSYQSFAWGGHVNLGPDLNDTAPVAHSVIKNGIEYYLTRGGLVEDEENPDLRVTYYTDEREVIQLQVMQIGYDYGPGWYANPFWGSGATSVARNHYDKGSLVIDIWDVETEKLIWRGVAVATIKEDPIKMVKQIDKAIDKIVKKWDSMRAKEK